LFGQGLVSLDTIHYLFEPEMNVISEETGETLVYRTKSWLDVTGDSFPEVGLLRCWSWSYDGKTKRDFKLEWQGSPREVKKINSLSVYPLRYAPENTEPDLFARGQKFWRCRKRIYVSYDDENMFGDPVQVCDYH
jgi:hypothetical protein